MLDYPMGTASGYAAFLDPEVNKHFKTILNEWGKVSWTILRVIQAIANFGSFSKLQNLPKFSVNTNKAGSVKSVCIPTYRILFNVHEPR